MGILAKATLWTVALCYGYGAAVHVLNILGMSGFSWSEAPLRWQALDLIYLALDLIVCVGLVLRSKLAIGAFYLAALSQIILYTLLRSWILDVPAAFEPTPEQRSYLWFLVAFHVVTLVLVTAALHFARNSRPSSDVDA